MFGKFLWTYLKSVVYTNETEMIDYLEDNSQSRGGHMPEVIFKFYCPKIIISNKLTFLKNIL